jgi:cell division transport system permease protein
MCRGIAASDTLQLLRIVSFVRIWEIVAVVFGAAGLLIGVGGSTMAIRRFLKV